MAKDIDLTSQKWMDLIFEGKNKSYGAYVLREESSNRHLKALVIVFVIGLAAVYLPGWIKGLIPESTQNDEGENLSVVEVTMSDLEEEVPEENIIRELENVPPPPVLKQTIQFTPPVIARDEEVGEEDVMATQQELTDSNAAISVATVNSGSGEGIDIADLQDNKVIVQATEPEIYSHVPQMPTYPDGDAALYKWISDNIKYPNRPAEMGIQGRVVMRFAVGADGSISKVTVMRSIDPDLDKEAIRVVSKMKKWNPGKNNGVPVAVWFTLPILFQLDN